MEIRLSAGSLDDKEEWLAISVEQNRIVGLEFSNELPAWRQLWSMYVESPKGTQATFRKILNRAIKHWSEWTSSRHCLADYGILVAYTRTHSAIPWLLKYIARDGARYLLSSDVTDETLELCRVLAGFDEDRRVRSLFNRFFHHKDLNPLLTMVFFLALATSGPMKYWKYVERMLAASSEVPTLSVLHVISALIEEIGVANVGDGLKYLDEVQRAQFERLLRSADQELRVEFRHNDLATLAPKNKPGAAARVSEPETPFAFDDYRAPIRSAIRRQQEDSDLGMGFLAKVRDLAAAEEKP